MADEYHNEGLYTGGVNGRLVWWIHQDMDYTFFSVECRRGALRAHLFRKPWGHWEAYTAYRSSHPSIQYCGFDDTRSDLERRGLDRFAAWHLSAGQTLELKGASSFTPSLTTLIPGVGGGGLMFDADFLLSVVSDAPDTEAYIIFDSVDP